MTELRELKVQLNEVTAMKSEIEDLKKQMNQKGDYTKSKFNRTREEDAPSSLSCDV